MKSVSILFTIILVIAAVVADDVLPLAVDCDEEQCQLPDCRCSGTDIPGGLAPEDTPQFVLVTFKDLVNITNIETYRRILYNRTNTNNCTSGATFFVRHEHTDYQLVNELYNNGFEIALNSISHEELPSYWAQADYDDIMLEFGDQKRQINYFAHINTARDDSAGLAISRNLMSGNATFQVIAEVGLLYDASWGTTDEINPGLWPYSLSYASTQTCINPPCPTASIPGTWVLPLLAWLDLEGTPCFSVDDCTSVPSSDDPFAWLSFIAANFKRHYNGNRAPFTINIHEWYLSAYPAIETALVMFMDIVNDMEDVHMINSAQVIEWVKNPIPLNEYIDQSCRSFDESPCTATTCGPYPSPHNDSDTDSYWITVCTECPNVYPWLGNPLGE